MVKKIILIAVLILIILLGVSLFTSSGRFFWNQNVVIPILKPFSEPCGYGGTSINKIQCECDGTMIKDIKMGSTNFYCFGECGECTCYKGYTLEEAEEIDCQELSELSWAFPLKS